MIYNFLILTKAFSEVLCPVDGGILILKDSIRISLELFQNRMKGTCQNNSAVTRPFPLREHVNPNHESKITASPASQSNQF